MTNVLISKNVVIWLQLRLRKKLFINTLLTYVSLLCAVASRLLLSFVAFVLLVAVALVTCCSGTCYKHISGKTITHG